MIPITSGLGLSLVWLGSMVVSVVIYGTVEPCGRAVCSVFFCLPRFHWSVMWWRATVRLLWQGWVSLLGRLSRDEDGIRFITCVASVICRPVKCVIKCECLSKSFKPKISFKRRVPIYNITGSIIQSNLRVHVTKRVSRVKRSSI